MKTVTGVICLRGTGGHYDCYYAMAIVYKTGLNKNEMSKEEQMSEDRLLIQKTNEYEMFDVYSHIKLNVRFC